MTNATTAATDRNFDPIAEHFAKKVYGGLKGRIRLAVLENDISQTIADLQQKHHRPLKILDVGAGLAQISLSLATDHHVTINDISANMLAMAKQSADALGVGDKVRLITCPYQALPQYLGDEKFDLILCHALLEWLGEPSEIMAFFDQYLATDGALSLCFYNPASLIYRNLVMGNFYQLDTPRPADDKSLTPNHPVAPETVETWLSEHGYTINIRSGIRVFSDYAPLKRGGLNNPDDVVAMELRYSRMMPFRLMGRYLHMMAVK
ncbi:methyltransferase domain-containing protein [Moraxella sp. FZFQ2102]|uniref:methyltransferase domain-containing protein n=1 Tax=Moraxella sp. FZFQ2102 TaxID=2953752 RepID=UPI00209BBB29|nr:methyltransferase domain-containing protein [Moraxella sp. FZFQ2102]USZ15237.1 methyltransferase domain-containing protein [Moraxella sp. FZFQ2102]